MTAASQPSDWPPGAWNETVERPAIGVTRWGGSLALALGAHAAAALAVVAWHAPLTPLAADPPAVLLELAPLPVAPPEPTPIAEAPPAPPPPEPVVEPPPEPPPPDPVVEPPPPPDPVVEPPPPEPPPVVEPEVALPKPPPDQPKPKPETPKPETAKPKPEKAKPAKPKPPRPVAAAQPTQPTAPPVAAPAPVAAAPAPSTAPSRVSPSWQGRVLSHLERYKRYPRAAQARRQEGVAQVRFTIDREGRVLAASLDSSAGHTLLDEETLEMVRRASPLPPPPGEMTQERIELVVPVQFFLK
jgi:periplasmic protein TonB